MWKVFLNEVQNRQKRVLEREEVRREVEEADRRAADVEVTPEGDELPDTGLSQEEAADEGRISKGLKASRRVTQAERERSTKGRTSRTGAGVTFA